MGGIESLTKNLNNVYLRKINIMIKYFMILLCFFSIQKAQAQYGNDNKLLSNEWLFNFGVGVSSVYGTNYATKKIKTLETTPIAELFLKKYFSFYVRDTEVPVYVALGSMVHMTNDENKPIISQLRVGYRHRRVTPFVAWVWQNAKTTDYYSHPDNKNYLGYGVEVNKRIDTNGVLYFTVSKNDRHVVAMVSMAYIF